MKIHKLALAIFLCSSCTLIAADLKARFSYDQNVVIIQKRLGSIIEGIIGQKKLVLKDNEQLIDFANEIRESGMAFPDLEERIVRYLAKNEPPFSALRQAIANERLSRWKTKRNADVKSENGPFMRVINQLGLDAFDRQKVVNAFAVCIDSYRRSRKTVEDLKPDFVNRSMIIKGRAMGKAA